MPKLIQVIESEISRGSGTEINPMRTVKQYHTPEGDLLAENDPCAPERDNLISGDCFTKVGRAMFRGDGGLSSFVYEDGRFVPMAEWKQPPR